MALLTRRSAVIPVLMSLLLPALAGADIYKWTDEQGGIVYSNSPPENAKVAGNIERVIKERAAPPREQVLQERIDALERRLQSQPYSPPASPAPPPPSVAPPAYSDGGYYYPPPPPDYTRYSVPAFFPVYRYPLLPAYSYVVYPRAIGARPAFHGGARGALRTGSLHHGRR